jgi:2-keto-4-pentenoate hydratase/2-oxohepta-3-ene-1,7-dioic acid hydratase in catechol pathway
MKLVRYGEFGHEKPGLIDKDGKLRDLSGQIKDLADDTFSPANLAKLAALDPASLPTVEGSPRLGSPVGGKPKFLAIGLNYIDHAKEAGMPIPSEPIVFMKGLNSLCGPNDDVEKPRGSTKLDWEVELAIIIGSRAKYISEADGLVTPDEVGDVHALSMYLDVNGERCQTGSTTTMIFNVPKIVSYLSEIMTLEPGDIITTGTPPGVGLGMKPPKFLNVGDVMTLGIEKLGDQKQKVVAV